MVKDQFQGRKGDWMQTASGRCFWPLDPRPEEVFIEDIAAHLSKMCRFGGATTKFYSVAEHSVILSEIVPKEFALIALLHDSAEAYCGDMVRPLKKSLDEYKAIEIGVQNTIWVKFGIAMWVLPDIVNEYDRRILMDERAQAMVPTSFSWDYGGHKNATGVKLSFWSPAEAEERFLARFEQLRRRPAPAPEVRQHEPSYHQFLAEQMAKITHGMGLSLEDLRHFWPRGGVGFKAVKGDKGD